MCGDGADGGAGSVGGGRAAGSQQVRLPDAGRVVGKRLPEANRSGSCC